MARHEGKWAVVRSYLSNGDFMTWLDRDDGIFEKMLSDGVERDIVRNLTFWQAETVLQLTNRKWDEMYGTSKH